MTTRSPAVLVCAAALAIAMTGCSSSNQSTQESATSSDAASSTVSPDASSSSPSPSVRDLTTEQLYNESKQAAESAETVHLRRIGVDASEESFDISGTLDGSSMRMTFQEGDQQNEVLITDGSAYVRGNEAYWLNNGGLDEEAYATLGDRWVKVSDDMRDSIMKKSSPGATIKVMYDTIALEDLTTGVTQTTDDDGTPVYTTGNGLDLVVTAEQESLLPVLLGNGVGQIRLDQWNAVDHFDAPDPNDVVDVSDEE